MSKRLSQLIINDEGFGQKTTPQLKETDFRKVPKLIRDINSSYYDSQRKYKYKKPIRKIKFANEIPPLFNNLEEVHEGVYKKRNYIGKIGTCYIKIEFDIEKPCVLCAETKESLDKAYHKISSSLPSNSPKNNN